MKSESAGQSLVLKIDGVFDLAAAQRILARLAKVPIGSEVHIDLTHVREFHDHGVAMLAEGLAETPARVSVSGLRTHQYRMLRYLGVRPTALDVGYLERPIAPTDAF